MRILITGSRGNIGTQLCKYLASRGHEVFGIDIVQGVGHNYKIADINTPVDMIEVFESFRPEACYHLAAMVSRVTCEASPAHTIQTNVAGSANIILLCRIYHTRLFFFSTSEVYGNTGGVLSEWREDLVPNNIYGISKLIGEHLVKYEITKGLSAVIVRPFMFYHEDETLGDHRSAVIRFVTDLMLGKPVEVHHGSGRSWMHLYDACMVLEALLRSPYNATVNIGSPEYIFTENLARLICDKLGRDPLKFLNITPLPERMTLSKMPSLHRMAELTGIDTMTVSLSDGIDRVIEKLRTRL